jgi:hypothetical protein
VAKYKILRCDTVYKYYEVVIEAETKELAEEEFWEQVSSKEISCNYEKHADSWTDIDEIKED